MDRPFYTLLKIKHTTLVYTNLGNLGKYPKLTIIQFVVKSWVFKIIIITRVIEEIILIIWIFLNYLTLCV
jgi:hypothetical protein